MVWTLWRGEELLGTVHPRSVPDAVDERDNRRTVNAVLVPEPAALPLPSVRQHRAGEGVVREHVREPHVTSIRQRVGSTSGRAIGVWPVSREPASPAPGVPPERQLCIRDENGRLMPTRSIGLLEHRPHPAHPPSELAALPDGAFIGGSVWLVHFTQDLDRSVT